jgi:serine/threonine protein kinase
VSSLQADGDPVEQLVREGVSPHCQVTDGLVWLTVVPAGTALPAHGWKLHVSCRAATFPDLVKMLVPVLAAEGCLFKLARSRQVLVRLNDGTTWPASVGKAVTIYPDQQRVRQLGLRLAGLLRGWQGPRVLSDRPVDRSAPVYYRYGPFTSDWESDEHGKLAAVLHGPEGEVFDGSATLAYRQPPWVTDPFTGQAGDLHTDEPTIVGGNYRITGGLRKAARGNVYRAQDARDGTAVVIKQARALVAEHGGQIDTRMRLRNERRVLQALDGVAGVPRLVDHFRHADDEFLVTSDCGPASLAQDVLRNGPYRAAGSAGSRGLGRLAAQLARIVSVVHGHGVIVRDLSPKNVVIGEGGASIVDFGIAAYDGLDLPGVTPGYAPARQWRGEPPEAADDYYALGMTLLFAASTLDPVSVGEDPGLPRLRALQTILATYGEAPTGVVADIADLLSDDTATARDAFRRLVSGTAGGKNRPASPLPAIGALTAQTAQEITGFLLEDLLNRTEQLLNSPPSGSAALDASMYSGSSGIGLELLQHDSSLRIARILADLARFTALAAERVKLPPGLFTGTTGVSVFLSEAMASGIDVPTIVMAGPGPDWQPAGHDLISGAAGAGLGYLRLYQTSGDPAHLGIAQRCGRYITSPTTATPLPLTGHWQVPGTDPAAGRAHGLAGVTGFLLALALQTGDEATRDAALQRVGQLAGRTRRLLPLASQPAVTPFAMSWCRGLSGIGQTLLRVSGALGDASLADLAREAADICIACLPRVSAPGRCCGAAGIGGFLIDLAIAGQDDRYWCAAERVGVQMLLRSAGPPGHPVFVRELADHNAVGWASGVSGLLSFFRRLARPGEADRFGLIEMGLPTAAGQMPG